MRVVARRASTVLLDVVSFHRHYSVCKTHVAIVFFRCPFITSILISECSTFLCLIICRAFKLDEDNALLTYVKQQLIPPTPPSTCTPPPLRAQDSIEELPYQRNVRKVVHKISCTASLLKLLVQVGSKVIDSSVVWPGSVLYKLVILFLPYISHCCNFSFLALIEMPSSFCI